LTPEREPEKRLPHLRKAAGAQITQSWHREVVTRNHNTRHQCLAIGMNETHTLFMSTHWRASLVPAAAVIPASIVYIKVVVVKKLVVEKLPTQACPLFG
jgi:hypothetical protein